MRTNIILFALVVFIISLIITLNIFFQHSYQSEMAEQFNRQQLIIAKSIAKSIEDEIQYIEAGTVSLARLIAEKSWIHNREGFISNTYAGVKAEGRLQYKTPGQQREDGIQLVGCRCRSWRFRSFARL